MAPRIRALMLAAAVVAIGYYLWHGLTYPSTGPEGDLGWFGWQIALPIAAVTVVPIVFAFSGEGIGQAFTGRNSVAFRAGLVGIGTVTSVRQTGVSVNDQPQVRLDLSVQGTEGETFDSRAKIIVPLTELALLRPGVVLPVRYLPGRTDRVEIDRSGDREAMQNTWNENMIRRGLTSRDMLDVAARGIAAQAVVQSLSVPGEIRDGYVKVVLDLAVTRPDGSTYTTHTEKFVPSGSVELVQIGRVVQVHYLPGVEDRVALALPVQT
ncbi:hypothetical protein KO481_28540 [Nocardia sp. NEAU-G5]|uniref:Uncharacterized protein n=1 Tax=Nocardia albiluteola TaxID=2842303 RepID=A0ABS6AXD6_9NOCA|nr:hypothetical protein [Nocardia albiluteola]MBU3062702.1 hypothetical protein [Nocardia albiluteola]MBU3065464.1 hypothetical protein [Nocardia albiluteola]